MAVTYDNETNEPDFVYQGERRVWEKTLTDYPATDWTLTYIFRGPTSLSLTAAASGGDFVVTLAATDSANLEPGTYQWQSAVSADSYRRVISNGTMEVYRDLAEVNTDYHSPDVHSSVRRAFENIEELLPNKSKLNSETGEDMLARVQAYKELRYLRMIEREREMIKRGNVPTNKIGVRFTES